MGVEEEGEGAFKIVHLPVPWHKKSGVAVPMGGDEGRKGKEGVTI